MVINSVSFRSGVNNTKPIKKEVTANINSVGGTIGAVVAGGAINSALPFLYGPTLVNLIKKQGTIVGENGSIVQNAVKEMLKDTQLDKKGVRIKFLNPIKIDADINNFINSEVKKNRNINLEKLERFIYDTLVINPIRKGENACFIPKDAKTTTLTLSECEKIYKTEGAKALQKKIKETQKVYIKKNSVLLPKESFHGAGFHELGHAMNFNFSKVGRFLQKCRPVLLYAPIVLGLYGAFSKKSKPKAENGKLTIRQKINNFIRDNAGKLAFIATLPMLIEEAMATVKGQKFANKLLKPELAKKVLKGNLVAYSSYLLMATTGAIATFSAVKIKDKAIERKEYKMKLQQELQAELNNIA